MVSTLRFVKEFDPEKFTGTVDVIGCGATGSSVGHGLARLGVEKVRLWDFDIVEAHNIANQKFIAADIGKPKAVSLALGMEEIGGVRPVVENRKCTGDDVLGEVVFLLTDTMSSRKDIWRAIRMALTPQFMVETRMGVDEGRIYCIDPRNATHIEAWEKTLCEDVVAEVSACGGKTVIGQTADILAGQALWYFLQWWKWSTGDGSEPFPPNETTFGCRPMSAYTRSFE